MSTPAARAPWATRATSARGDLLGVGSGSRSRLASFHRQDFGDSHASRHSKKRRLRSREAFPILRRLRVESNVVGFDRVEFAPERDPSHVSGPDASRIVRVVVGPATVKSSPVSDLTGP